MHRDAARATDHGLNVVGKPSKIALAGLNRPEQPLMR